MKLSELGLSQQFAKQAKKLCKPGQLLARVTVVDRGWYIIRNEEGEVSARATGKFLHTTDSTCDMPCVGDWVLAQYQDSEKAAYIHAVLPRKTFLQRKSIGQSVEIQMIAANIDVALIVQSCHYDFNIPRLERYLVMVHEGRVKPLLVLTKTDLISSGKLQQLITEIRNVGISTKIFPLSNISGEGLKQLKETIFPGTTYCLLGSSGVGKSTIINQITGHNSLKTRAVAESGEGRHTTVRRQLIVLEHGAMLIDTPGMREVGLLGVGEGISESFDNIEELSQSCRFTNCNHVSEPGCAVLQAVEEGKLQNRHLQNYLKIKKESELNKISYTEKRKTNKNPAKGAHLSTKHKVKYI